MALGAGKGMHSRLYRRVLNQYEWVHNCTAFSSLYNDSGLVGIFISTDRARSGQSFDIITKELQVRLHISEAGGHPIMHGYCLCSTVYGLASSGLNAEHS